MLSHLSTLAACQRTEKDGNRETDLEHQAQTSLQKQKRSRKSATQEGDEAAVLVKLTVQLLIHMLHLKQRVVNKSE